MKVTQFCFESNLNESAVRDVLDTIGLDRNSEDIDSGYATAIIEQLANSQGKVAALPPANLPQDTQLKVKEAVELVHEIYPEELVLDDIRLTGITAFINASKEAEVYTRVHERTFSNRISDYRNAHTEGLYKVAEASKNFSVKNLMPELGVGEEKKLNRRLEAFTKLLSE